MRDGVPEKRGRSPDHAAASESASSLGQTPAASDSGSSGSLAEMLCPILRQVCGGRLSPVQWFRAAWQAGGASTGTAQFQLRPGRTVDAVVKLPVGPQEYNWTTTIGRCDHAVDHHDGPTPRVLAAGTELGGYDLAWLVVEKLDGQPISTALSQDNVEGLLSAAADWYAAADRERRITPDDRPRREDWVALVSRAREAVKDNALPDEQRWNEALKATQRALPRLVPAWEARAVNSWCHGDLHPGNAMLRSAPDRDQPRCVLIDLALVHPGHWVEDALYLERLYWAKPELLCGVKPVPTLARFRRDRGLHASDDYGTLAQIRRVLMAASVPAFLEHEGHPRYVHAALETLERTLPLVPH